MTCASPRFALDEPSGPAETVVIVGTYNNADHVQATIASLRMQTYGHWACIVVDNGSTDQTVAELHGLVEGDPRFRLICKRNEGPSAGRNLGLREAPCDAAFIHFLDGDDLLHRGFLLELTDYLRAHPQVGLVGCQFDVIDAAGQVSGPGERSRWAPSRWGLPRKLSDTQVDTPFEAFFSATGQGPFALFRASVLRQTSGYEEDFWSHEDADIFCQMALLAPVHYLPARLYQKRVHGHNLTASPKADYSKFRNKWDHIRLADADQDSRIDGALRYYHGMHLPFRHFKVAVLAAGEWIGKRHPGSLRWCLTCLRNGFADLLLRRSLRARLRARRAHSTDIS